MTFGRLFIALLESLVCRLTMGLHSSPDAIEPIPWQTDQLTAYFSMYSVDDGGEQPRRCG